MIYYHDYNIDVYDWAFDEKTRMVFYPVLIQKYTFDSLIKEKWIYIAADGFSRNDIKNDEMLEKLLALPENTKIKLTTSFEFV